VRKWHKTEVPDEILLVMVIVTVLAVVAILSACQTLSPDTDVDALAIRVALLEYKVSTMETDACLKGATPPAKDDGPCTPGEDCDE
jgi:hypothetical protein